MRRQRPGTEIHTDGAWVLTRLSDHGFTHRHTPGYLASDLDAVMPGPHLVSSLLKRWTAGTLHHRISRQHLPYYSQVLAIHAALLRTGHVLFFAGSGNNTVREADPSYGDVNQHMWTCVVWDPDAPPGANFSHPATLQRADGRPFDFFCCGHAPLSDASSPGAETWPTTTATTLASVTRPRSTPRPASGQPGRQRRTVVD